MREAHRGLDHADRAEQLAVEFGKLPSFIGVPAGITVVIGFVYVVPPEHKMSPGHRPGLLQRCDMQSTSVILRILDRQERKNSVTIRSCARSTDFPAPIVNL